MAKLAVGSVVLVSFPFLRLRPGKLRPALVLASASSNEWIFCQITSKAYGSRSAIRIEPGDFESGGLPTACFAHPETLFTADAAISTRVVGMLNVDYQRKILAAVRGLFI